MACGPGRAGDSSGGSDTSSEAIQRPSDPGENCAGGCSERLCALVNEGCGGGYCLWDGNLGTAYCSLACDASCPDGYTCTETDDNTGSFCFSETPECGNGSVEYGEACDDGNTEGQDTCSPGCGEVTVPPSGGRVSLSFDGGALVVAEGLEPVVRADLYDTILFFGTGVTPLDFGLTLAADAGTAALTLWCTSGACSFGCNESFGLSVEFDLRWNVRQY